MKGKLAELEALMVSTVTYSTYIYICHRFFILCSPSRRRNLVPMLDPRNEVFLQTASSLFRAVTGLSPQSWTTP